MVLLICYKVKYRLRRLPRLDELEFAVFVGHLSGPVFLLPVVTFTLHHPAIEDHGHYNGKQAKSHGSEGRAEVLEIANSHGLEPVNGRVELKS